MHTQDSSEHGSLSARFNLGDASCINEFRTRLGKLLAVAVGLTLAGAAQANLVVPVVYPAPPPGFNPVDAFLLLGGQSSLVFDGQASGTVSQIDVSFFFSPLAEQTDNGPNFASDFSLIIVPPGQAPQLFGGNAAVPLVSPITDGRVYASTWNFLNNGKDMTYSDQLTTGLGSLTGTGEWQIFILNGFQGSPNYVAYSDLHITLEGLSTPVPEGFFAGGTLACLGGVIALLGVFRWRVRAL